MLMAGSGRRSRSKPDEAPQAGAAFDGGIGDDKEDFMEMDRSHFWLASFQNQEQIDEYFREGYGDDDEPISLFAADQGATFYDHDWVFVESSEGGDLEKLLQKA